VFTPRGVDKSLSLGNRIVFGKSRHENESVARGDDLQFLSRPFRPISHAVSSAKLCRKYSENGELYIGCKGLH